MFPRYDRCLVIFLAMGSATGFAKSNSRAEEASFVRSGSTFRIKAVATEVTEPNTFENLKVEYSVYKDGKFIRRSDRSGGSTWGCLYGDPHKLPKDIIKPLVVGNQQVGWSFDLYGICGNTTSKHDHFVVIQDAKEKSTYFAKDFISKTSPILQTAPDGQSATVWYIYQEWGDAGTAGSFFVPRVFQIVPTGKYQVFTDGGLPKDIKAWPTFDGLPYSKPSYVVAGINELEGAPIRAAAENLTKEDLDQLKYVGLPNTKEALLKIADGIDIAGLTIKKFYRNK